MSNLDRARASAAVGPLTVHTRHVKARSWHGSAAVLLLLTVLFLDQWTKRQIEGELGPASAINRVDLVGSWFALEYAQNRGGAFGLLGGRPEVVTVGALVILGGLLTYALRRRDDATWWLGIGIGLVAGGALGNLVDRLRQGYVVDFVAVGAWPNFNVADAAISLGVVCQVIDGLMGLSGVTTPTTAEATHLVRSRRGSTDA